MKFVRVSKIAEQLNMDVAIVFEMAQKKLFDKKVGWHTHNKYELAIYEGSWASYTSDGYSWAEGSLSDNDLFMAPTKKQGWMNIYSSYTYNVMAGGGNIYKTYQEAIENSMDGLITTVMVEWEE